MFRKTLSIALIVLHIATFGPLRDALAFKASSTSYDLTSGAVTQGGKGHAASTIDIFQGATGEPCAARAESASFILSSGFVPTIQSNPPVFSGNCPGQAWKVGEAKNNAIDLDDYFNSDNGNLTFTVVGNSNINVSIDPLTHLVSFSHAEGWQGRETVYFKATDPEGNVTTSNTFTLCVGNGPVITTALHEPVNIVKGDVIRITLAATDVDNQPLTFSCLPAKFVFNRIDNFHAEATWQTGVDSIGSWTVVFKATDPDGLSDSRTLNFTVKGINHPPVLNPIPDQIINDGDLLVLDAAKLTVIDADNDQLAFIYSAPLDAAGRWQTTFADSGAHTAQVRAFDGRDYSAPQTVNIIVNNINRPPTASLTSSRYSVRAGDDITATVNIGDPDCATDNQRLSFSLTKDGTEILSGNNIAGPYTTTVTTRISPSGDHKLVLTSSDGALSAVDSKTVDADDQLPRSPLMGDFNGDSLSDLGLHNTDNGLWEVCLSDGGVFRAAEDWLNNFAPSRDWWPVGGDFNGDAKSDIGAYHFTNGQLQIALSNGSGFIASPANPWLTFSGASYSWQPFTGNFNADKYTDFGLYNKDNGEIKIALGTGTGFLEFTTQTGFDAGSDCVAFAADFNSDAVTDLCLFRKSSGEFKVYPSNTRQFVDGKVWITGFASGKDPLISDFNNDGLADVGYWEKGGDKWYYAISTGEGFVEKKKAWLTGFGSGMDDSATTGDFNGDSLTDAAVFNNEATGMDRWSVRLSTKRPADLLTRVNNGIGGRTEIAYTYYSAQNAAEKQVLPFPVYVTSSVSLVDTLPVGQPEEMYGQRFNYAGGYFDTIEREFRGFAEVKVSDPITQNYTISYFFQGRREGTPEEREGALKGQLRRIVALDGNAHKICETVHAYSVKKAGPGVGGRFLGFPALVSQTATAYEENGASLATENTFEYDALGNMTTQKNLGDTSLSLTDRVEKNSYTNYAAPYQGGFNRPLDVYLKDKNGAVLTEKHFEYDARGNLTKETGVISNPITQKRDNVVAEYSYDDFGNMLSSTNSRGFTATTVYEATFNTYPERITNALNQSVTYIYDPKFGAAKSITDANNQTQTSNYDTYGRLLSVENALRQTPTVYSYPDFNTKVTRQGNLAKTEYIDGIGRKYKVESSGEDGAAARTVSSETFYNIRGQVSAESLPHYIDENPNKISYVRYEYDIRGRLKRTISDFYPTKYNANYPFNLTDEVTLDPADAASSVNYREPLYTETIDPNGHKKGARKDVYGNVVEVMEFVTADPEARPDGAFHTCYAYDLQNNLVKTTDNLNNITQIFYDSAGRKLRMLDPDMGEWSYEYDSAGNLIRQTDAKKQVLEFQYDALNRLIKKSAASGAQSVDITAYIYDDASKPNCIGRLSKVVYQNGGTEFFYDKLGRETKSVKTIGSTPYVVERAYDELDRLTALTYPDAETVNYSYDSHSGLLERVYSQNLEPKTQNPLPPADYVSDITYNASGQILNILYGNNVTTDYTYGQDMRLENILTKNTNLVTLQDLHYLFDRNGNVARITNDARSNYRDYTYDELDRLTGLRITDLINHSPSPIYSYTYNSIGNMLTKTDGGATMEMRYGQSAGPHAVTSVDGLPYRYDLNGNLTQGKNKAFTYDVENRLQSAAVDSGLRTETYAYDGDGGRVKKITTSPEPRVISETIYIGSLYEINTNEQGETKTVKHIFAGANRVCTVNSINSTNPINSINYFHPDHLGSSNVITDATGAQVQYVEYAPYGGFAKNEVAGGQSPVTSHYFTGKELDSTGLYFYGARYYDPEIGRFITADTLVQAPYDPQTLNRYTYCRDNPIKYVDPTGHWFWMALIIGAILGAVSSGIQSDWNPKAMLIGAAIGAVSSVVGFGAAKVTADILGRVLSAAFGGMVGGATAGFLNSAYYGGDMLRGTLMGAGLGALGGLAFGALSQINVTDVISGLTKCSLYAAVGGGLSELGGGEFWQGAVIAVAVAMSEIIYKSVVATDENGRKNPNPSMDVATGDAKPKKLGPNGEVVVHNDGSAEVGTAYKPNSKPVGFEKFVREDNRILQGIAKNVPGINRTAVFHDIITHWYSSTPIGFTNGFVFNFQTMVPSFAITVLGSAAASQYAPILGPCVVYGEERA